MAVLLLVPLEMGMHRVAQSTRNSFRDTYQHQWSHSKNSQVALSWWQCYCWYLQRRISHTLLLISKRSTQSVCIHVLASAVLLKETDGGIVPVAVLLLVPLEMSMHRVAQSTLDSLKCVQTVPIKFTCSCRLDRLWNCCASAFVCAGHCSCPCLSRAGHKISTDKNTQRLT